LETKHQLVADIGGTNARFALCIKGSDQLKNVQSLSCEKYASPVDAIEHYLKVTDATIESACLAVAGPVGKTEDFVKLTNNSWGFSQSQLVHRFSIHQLVCINDFTAAAMATTVITPENLFFLSENTQFDPTQQRCILGPGTGLGVAGILPYQEKTLVLSTEGGNRSFSPENELEDYILKFLRSELQTVSCEALLSGNGLVNIYRAICSLERQTLNHPRPEMISTAALRGDQTAQKTLQVFFEILGSVAGDCALTFGATGGVYIGGGIAPKFPEALLQSKFRERFESKLNYKHYLKKIPTAIVMHPHAGLLGAAAYLKEI